jgi:hypothetical protein
MVIGYDLLILELFVQQQETVILGVGDQCRFELTVGGFNRVTGLYAVTGVTLPPAE